MLLLQNVEVKLWKHFKCDQLVKTLINYFHKHYNCNKQRLYKL